MCGIAGEIRWSKGSKPEWIGAMLHLMRHRGPDMGGILCRGAVALGHRRLSIIEPSPKSRQPMVDHSGRYWIVFNGEIYNYRELKSELSQQGASFGTESDTEVILEAFKAWGPACVRRLNGMFAFVIWNEADQSAFLARDRTGKKPLYIFHTGEGLIFASELTALLAHPDVPIEVSAEGVSDYLSLSYVPTERCMINGVRKLPPAHHWTVRQGGSEAPIRYWDLAAHYRQKAILSEADAAERLAELIDDSVRLRLVSDVPLGAFLSGGVDSSSIVASMVALQGGGRTLTFSVGFNEKTYSELAQARSAALAIGPTHQDAVVESPCPEDIERICAAMDEPIADTSFVPMWYLSRFARRHVTVCLSGDGGDEAFGGYQTYRADWVRHLLRHVPPAFLAVLPALATLVPVTHHKVSFDYKLRQFARGCMWDADRAHYHWREIFDFEEKKALLRPEHRVACQDTFQIFRRFSDEIPDCHFLDRAMYTDIKTWLVDDILAKVDRSSMAHSLEARAPFLDYRVLEFAASLPVAMKVNWMRGKHILKKSQAGRVPRALLYRTKQGFNAPISHWLAAGLEEFVRAAIANPRLSEWVVAERVAALWREHKNRRRDNGYRLFTLLCLGLWLERIAVRPPVRIDSDIEIMTGRDSI